MFVEKANPQAYYTRGDFLFKVENQVLCAGSEVNGSEFF